MIDPVDRLSSVRARVLGWILGVTGVSLHLAGFFVLTLHSEVPEESSRGFTADIVLPADSSRGFEALVSEQALLQDTEPLILPTRWNAPVPKRNFEVPPSAAGLLAPFPPVVALPEPLPEERVLPYPREQATPLDVLQHQPGWLRGAFEGPALQARPLPERQGQVEVRDAATGRLLRSETLDLPDMPVGEDELWQPASFLWTVAERAASGRPLIREGTGNTDLDAYLLDTLTTLPPLARLGPGTYEITVGP
ncbi:MAG: hypothetical protein ACFB21_16520 [Opitutales bacterium]